MPEGVKLLFTTFLVAVYVGVLFARSKANNAGPKWLWRGGSNDLLRQLLFRSDGSLRKYTKLAIGVWFMFYLAVLWLVVPSSS